MAEDNVVSLVKQSNGCYKNSTMHDNRVNGVVREMDQNATRIWGRNGKHFNNGREILTNGFHIHKTSILVGDAIRATSLRSSPTRNKTMPVVHSGSIKKEVNAESRLTEVAPNKGGILCKWMDCGYVATDIAELAGHAKEHHIDPMKYCDVFVCLWQDCKVFNRPSCSMTWLTKHLESHIGVKPFKCVIDGCALSFSSRPALARHVPCHFDDNIRPAKKPATAGKEESPSKKHLKRKRLKHIRYKKANGKTEDFVDQHAVDSIKSRLSDMIVTDTDHVGIDGPTIHFKSQAWGRRVDEKRGTEVLLHWIPESILPDEWIPSNEVKKHLRRSIPIRSLPNHVKADLHPSFYRRLSHRKERRK